MSYIHMYSMTREDAFLPIRIGGVRCCHPLRWRLPQAKANGLVLCVEFIYLDLLKICIHLYVSWNPVLHPFSLQISLQNIMKCI